MCGRELTVRDRAPPLAQVYGGARLDFGEVRGPAARPDARQVLPVREADTVTDVQRNRVVHG